MLVALVAGTRPQIIHGINMLIRQTRHRQIVTKISSTKEGIDIRFASLTSILTREKTLITLINIFQDDVHRRETFAKHQFSAVGKEGNFPSAIKQEHIVSAWDLNRFEDQLKSRFERPCMHETAPCLSDTLHLRLMLIDLVTLYSCSAKV